MREIICISGDLASGKTEVGTMLSAALGYSYFSAGMIFRMLAEEKGMDLLELTALSKTDPSIDRAIDSRIIEIGRSAEKIIFDSRMAWHFVKGGFNVYLKIDRTEAAKRILNDIKRGSVEKYRNFDEAYAAVEYRSNAEAERYMAQYGTDIHDMNNYNLIIDTTEKTERQVVELIIDGFKKYLEIDSE